MRSVRVSCCAAAIAWSRVASAAGGLGDLGDDLKPREKFEASVDGYLRARGQGLYNLDLDRGLLPSGQPLFPTPLGDPRAQWLTHGDMRLRTDVALYAPGGAVAVKVRADVLDNVALGSMPEGVPYASLTQRPTGALVSLRRAYGEALLPFGYLAVGRMGNHWGLGMYAHGGDCIDCDSGDAVDRVAFATPLAGHIFAVAYDFSATLAQVARASDRTIGVAPISNVRSVSFAALNVRSDLARDRRRKASKATFEYGALGSYRWQQSDVPGSYIAQPGGFSLSDAQVTSRAANYYVFDGFFRLTHPELTIAAEAAYAGGQVDNASLVPGVVMRQPIKSAQVGAVLETEIGTVTSPFGFGVDAGYASGDPGAILGAEPTPPNGGRVDEFRFHPDYRVDRILFREIIGTVTGATFVRPHARARLWKAPSGELRAELFGVASFASAANWSPSGDRMLGVEIDPGLVYRSRDGFYAALDYAALIPMSGMDNPNAGLTARSAQLVAARVGFLFGGGR